MSQARCAALFIAAPASGQGKTSVTAGLLDLLDRLSDAGDAAAPLALTSRPGAATC